MTDPETITALLERLRKNGPVHCHRNAIDYDQAADTIAALTAEIARLKRDAISNRIFDANANTFHALARQEGFAAGVEAAANAVIGYIHPDYGRLPGEAFASAQIRAIKPA